MSVEEIKKIDKYELLRNLSEEDKDIIKNELFKENTLQFQIKTIWIGEHKSDETYQAVLNYENKITNNFIYSILHNKNYVDYFYRKDYHRSINELSDEMERDILSNLEVIKELLNIQS